MRQNYVII